jgi:biotin synthase
MNSKISKIADVVLNGGELDRALAKELSAEGRMHFDDLLYWANEIRQRFFSNKVRVCSIVPGRLGGCDQDCKFCAQSIRYNTHVEKKAKVLSDEEILTAAKEAKDKGVANFGIVHSGKKISESELSRIENLTVKIKNKFGLGVCASLGILTSEQAGRLASAGVSRYNHNLETSEGHFKNIVTTHKYAERIKTIEAVKEVGLGVCAGGIFGIGETEADRIDMAFELRRLKVDMVPMNFLHPIEGTPLGDMETLQPREILRIVALYRFILPKTHIKVAGGRVLNLRDLQSWIFYAGCTSIISGNYLTTAGRAVEEDIQMIKDCGLVCE